MRTVEWGGLTVRVVGGTDGDGGGSAPTVVLLHGFGAPGDDLVPLAGAIEGGVRFVFPAAPLGLPPEYGMGRAWWPIDMVRLQMAMMTGQVRDMSRETPEGLEPARERVVAMLGAMREALRLEATPIWLGGFSQGAMLACDVALRTTEPLAGLVLMSGTMLCETDWIARMSTRAGLSVLMSHGRQDPLLPFAVAERLRDEFEQAGARVTWMPFDGGHGIPPTVLDALGRSFAGC